ncbi:hypothetical protein GIB67_036156 [Kingdonia uniflora]|uniref:FAS1 domain-containing protein n=1 Tax=Kingdonia uniflora TaxID=39325 RepID=A0A7J7N983_9MAGN|nr:hypothetical protein GIB67_036156 [Kingdonia uniflora]
MLTTLRIKGYNLFGNAITTSDIHYEILAGTSFTFFAPTDSSLFALDMTATASDYVLTLRYHVLPRRFSITDLRSNSSSNGSEIPTIAANRDLYVTVERSSEGGDVVSVNGVDVVLPGLFYGRNVAVHGLSGILDVVKSNGERSITPALSPRIDGPDSSPPETGFHDLGEIAPSPESDDIFPPFANSPEYGSPMSVYDDYEYGPSSSSDGSYSDEYSRTQEVNVIEGISNKRMRRILSKSPEEYAWENKGDVSEELCDVSHRRGYPRPHYHKSEF